MTEKEYIEVVTFMPPKNEFGNHMYVVDYSIIYKGKKVLYSCTMRTLRAAFFFAMYIYEEQGYAIERIADERNNELYFDGRKISRNKEELNTLP